MSNPVVNAVSVAPLAPSHLTRLASIHCGAFPHSALTQLGVEAVRRYYEWLLTGPHDAVCVGAFSGGTLVGFCFAGRFRGALSGFLARNRGYLMRRVLARPWLALNALFRERLGQAVNILGRGKRSFPSTPSSVPVSSFGVLAIAVDPASQGQGAGRALMEYAETVARGRGFSLMNLTVAVNNIQAIRFYEGIGWQKSPEGELWLGRMVRVIESSTSV
jgi:ribosomal protein S18 acetylase RimI-like enzyme